MFRVFSKPFSTKGSLHESGSVVQPKVHLLGLRTGWLSNRIGKTCVWIWSSIKFGVTMKHAKTRAEWSWEYHECFARFND